MTTRDLMGQLGALRDPPAMSIEEALAADDPVFEIGIRLSLKNAPMSDPEQVFWSVTSYVNETQDAGLAQAMSSETGELLPLVAEFARRYGSPELVAVLEELAAARPGDPATLDQLAERLSACEVSIYEGLVALARKNASRFDLGGKA